MMTWLCDANKNHRARNFVQFFLRAVLKAPRQMNELLSRRIEGKCRAIMIRWALRRECSKESDIARSLAKALLEPEILCSLVWTTQPTGSEKCFLAFEAKHLGKLLLRSVSSYSAWSGIRLKFNWDSDCECFVKIASFAESDSNWIALLLPSKKFSYIHIWDASVICVVEGGKVCTEKFPRKIGSAPGGSKCRQSIFGVFSIYLAGRKSWLESSNRCWERRSEISTLRCCEGTLHNLWSAIFHVKLRADENRYANCAFLAAILLLSDSSEQTFAHYVVPKW